MILEEGQLKIYDQSSGTKSCGQFSTAQKASPNLEVIFSRSADCEVYLSKLYNDVDNVINLVRIKFRKCKRKSLNDFFYF